MRRLTLKRETVAELTNDELGGVVGAAVTDVCTSEKVCVKLPTWDACFTTHGCG